MEDLRGKERVFNVKMNIHKGSFKVLRNTSDFRLSKRTIYGE